MIFCVPSSLLPSRRAAGRRRAARVDAHALARAAAAGGGNGSGRAAPELPPPLYGITPGDHIVAAGIDECAATTGASSYITPVITGAATAGFGARRHSRHSASSSAHSSSASGISPSSPNSPSRLRFDRPLPRGTTPGLASQTGHASTTPPTTHVSPATSAPRHARSRRHARCPAASVAVQTVIVVAFVNVSRRTAAAACRHTLHTVISAAVSPLVHAPHTPLTLAASPDDCSSPSMIPTGTSPPAGSPAIPRSASSASAGSVEPPTAPGNATQTKTPSHTAGANSGNAVAPPRHPPASRPPGVVRNVRPTHDTPMHPSSHGGGTGTGGGGAATSGVAVAAATGVAVAAVTTGVVPVATTVVAVATTVVAVGVMRASVAVGVATAAVGVAVAFTASVPLALALALRLGAFDALPLTLAVSLSFAVALTLALADTLTLALALVDALTLSEAALAEAVELNVSVPNSHTTRYGVSFVPHGPYAGAWVGYAKPPGKHSPSSDALNAKVVALLLRHDAFVPLTSPSHAYTHAVTGMPSQVTLVALPAIPHVPDGGAFVGTGVVPGWHRGASESLKSKPCSVVTRQFVTG